MWASKQGYTVSDTGEVYSPDGTKRKLQRDKDGYTRFSVTIVKELNEFKVTSETRVYSIPVHRLSAYQKFGNKLFKTGIIVRHLDNDCRNNYIDNIGIGTYSDNRMDIPADMRRLLAINAGRKRSKLTDKDIVDIRLQFDAGATIKEIMLNYAIAKSTASYIKNRITYTYL